MRLLILTLMLAATLAACAHEKVVYKGEAVDVSHRVFLPLGSTLTAREPVYQRKSNEAGEVVEQMNRNTAALIKANTKLEAIEKCQGTSVDEASAACAQR